MLNRVVGTLLETPEIARVVVLTQYPAQLMDAAGFRHFPNKRVTFIASLSGIAESILSAFDAGKITFPALVTTADHPLLTPTIVGDFVSRALSCDLAVGVVERRAVLRRYPDAQRTWLKFLDGAYTGANLFAFSNTNVRAGLRLWAKAEQDRKQAFKLFWHFGPRLALRALTRTITFAKGLERAGRNLGCKADLVVLQHPDAAIDVDKIDDHALVERILRSRPSARAAKPSDIKVIILSAGRGSRLGSLTDTRPKCLVPVGGKTILDHQVDALAENGLDDITIVVGCQHEAIRRHVQQLDAKVRTRLIYNPFWSVGSSIGSVWAARELVEGPFMLINGDTIFDATLLRSALERLSPGVNLLVEEAPHQDDDMRVALTQDRITAVGKHLPWDEASHRSLGIVISMDAHGGPYHAALDRIISAPGGIENFHHEIIDHLARTGGVQGINVTDGRWQEIDRPEDIEAWLIRTQREAA